MKYPLRASVISVDCPLDRLVPFDLEVETIP
jgi:hypothetical protein